MRIPLLIATLALASAAGCGSLTSSTHDPSWAGRGPGAIQLPPVTVYQSSTGPLSHRAAVAESTSLREVRGEVCQSALTFPLGLLWAAVESGSTARAPTSLSLAWGEAGYAEAVSQALGAVPGGRLANVRADLRTKIILGVWRQQCVRVTAQAVPPSS